MRKPFNIDLNQAKKHIFVVVRHRYLSMSVSFFEGPVLFTKTGILMSGAALCSVQIHRIVPCQVTLKRTHVLHVHQSTIRADKDVSAKNINLVTGSYGRIHPCLSAPVHPTPVISPAKKLEQN